MAGDLNPHSMPRTGRTIVMFDMAIIEIMYLKLRQSQLNPIVQNLSTVPV